MSPGRRRALLFLVPGVAVGVIVLIGLLGMPSFGHPIHHYARHIADAAQRQRHVSNLVVSVVFDYRGVDTLGEELILFTAVIGATLLLRDAREKMSNPPADAVESSALRGYGGAFVAPFLLVGLWTVAFGYITPGGGFQGGVVAGSAALLMWITGSYRIFAKVTPELLIHLAEGGAVLGIVATGLLAFADHQPYLTNVLALGTPGQLTSGGTIAVLNGFTGLAVGAGLVLLFREFLQEHIATVPGVEDETS